MAWEDFSTVFVMRSPFTLFAFPVPFSLLPDIDPGTHGTLQRGTQGGEHEPGEDAAGRQDQCW